VNEGNTIHAFLKAQSRGGKSTPRGRILTSTWVDLKQIGKLDAGRSYVREKRGVVSNSKKNCANWRHGITGHQLFYRYLIAMSFTK
jgi:hypothetical protein